MTLQDDIDTIYKLDAISRELAYSGTKAETDVNREIQKNWPLVVSTIRRLEAENREMKDILEDWYSHYCEVERIDGKELLSRTAKYYRTSED